MEGEQSSSAYCGLFKLHIQLAREDGADAYLAAATREVAHMEESTIWQGMKQGSASSSKVQEGTSPGIPSSPISGSPNSGSPGAGRGVEEGPSPSPLTLKTGRHLQLQRGRKGGTPRQACDSRNL